MEFTILIQWIVKYSNLNLNTVLNEEMRTFHSCVFLYHLGFTHKLVCKSITRRNKCWLYFYESIRQNRKFVRSDGECMSRMRRCHINIFNDEVGQVYETPCALSGQHFDELLYVLRWLLIFWFILAQVFPNSLHLFRKRFGVSGQLKR